MCVCVCMCVCMGKAIQYIYSTIHEYRATTSYSMPDTHYSECIQYNICATSASMVVI